MPQEKVVMVGDRKFRLPYIDLIPMSEADDRDLGESILRDGQVTTPVVCWKEAKSSGEDVVINGAHRCVWASVHKLDRVPVVYKSYGSELEARLDVIELNITGRKLTPEILTRAKSLRVELTVEWRKQCESLRAIAAKTGESVTTVRRRLKKSGVPGGTPDEVVGRDGKKYAANPVVCGRCKRLGSPVKDCRQCATERRKKAQRTAKAKEQKADEAKRLDCFKVPVPAKRCGALFDPLIQHAIDFLAKLSQEFRDERLAEKLAKKAAHWPFIDAKQFADGYGFVIQYFDDLLEHLHQNRPAALCPKCAGGGCGTCRMGGLLPRKVYGELKA